MVATKSKGSARGELVEANQDEPEWSSEDEDESLGDTLQTWTQKQRKLLGIQLFYDNVDGVSLISWLAVGDHYYHRCNDVINRGKGHRITHFRTKN